MSQETEAPAQETTTTTVETTERTTSSEAEVIETLAMEDESLGAVGSGRNDNILSRISFRQVIPANIPDCFNIEKSSYPSDESATKSALQYRQHFAEKYFRCAVLHEYADDDGEHDETSDVIIGFICATRCRQFTTESMTTHDATGPMLAIHSVVVMEEYRHLGVATKMMMEYLETMKSMADGVERLALLSKAPLLPFYVKCGFSVLGLSDVNHGQEQWYHLEMVKDCGKPCWVVDSFTETPGQGNPAAVVLLDSPYEEDQQRQWCQTVAREFNLSETAFVWKLVIPSIGEEEAGGSAVTTTPGAGTAVSNNIKYGIRYFSPNGIEIDLCGHASLAAAVVLFQQEPRDSLVFVTKLGVQLVMTPCKYFNGKRMQICMNFPQKKLKEVSTNDRRLIVAMLQRAFPHQKRIDSNVLYAGLDEDGGDLLVEVTPELLMNLGYGNDIVYPQLDWSGYTRGVIICCIAPNDPNLIPNNNSNASTSVIGGCTGVSNNNSNNGADVWSRFFAPKTGIQEDPVTGSAHCTIAPYFCKKLVKTELKAEQKSERGGMINCTLLEKENRVTLTGSAVVTMSGTTWV